MRPLRTWFCAHDYLRHHSPGHLRLRCAKCGHETPGLTGPVAHVEPPVVTARRLPKPKAPTLKVVKARRTA